MLGEIDDDDSNGLNMIPFFVPTVDMVGGIVNIDSGFVENDL